MKLLLVYKLNVKLFSIGGQLDAIALSAVYNCILRNNTTCCHIHCKLTKHRTSLSIRFLRLATETIERQKWIHNHAVKCLVIL